MIIQLIMILIQENKKVRRKETLPVTFETHDDALPTMILSFNLLITI